ncbi:MAG TPA: DinB family protein [Thermoanaerobaculia bacterium]|nr:DinB family protein [Thermoanaerobaculia bacterium]
MTTAAPDTTEATRLADQLERAYRGGAWHGPALAEALDGVDAATAARRPIGSAHTIWEIVAHVSVWTEVCRRRIAGEAIRDLAAEEDWPASPPAGVDGRDGGGSVEDAWRRELATLDERHRRLHAAVAALDDGRLDDPVAGSDPTVRGLLLGVLQHHAYHGGQIVLLAKAGAGA